mgnify:CR=1 FL=1
MLDLVLLIHLVHSALALDLLAVTGGTDGVNYTTEKQVVTILTNIPLSISGDSCGEIVIAGSEVNIHFENLRIDPMSGNAITVGSGGDVHVILAGANQIHLMGGGALLQNDAISP